LYRARKSASTAIQVVSAISKFHLFRLFSISRIEVLQKHLNKIIESMQMKPSKG